MTQLLKEIILALTILTLFSCGDAPSEETAKSSTEKVESKTIAGKVKSIAYGKDGYTAQVNTVESGEYAALVSIINLGGPDHYQQVNINDKVVFTGVPSTLNGERRLIVKKIIKIESARTVLTIEENAFRGITVGDKIDDHLAYLEKKKMRDGEGTFDIYEIKDFGNNPAGYFVSDFNDEGKVSDITVTTPKATTTAGIKVGSTFEELSKVFPNIEVHGSEIEGRTYAKAGNLSYRLEVVNFSYEVDVNKIPANTKITEIIINRGFNAEAVKLNERYSTTTADEYCWLAMKKVELHNAPNTTAKVEGPHFQGEVLKVLDSKIINNELWVNVQFTLQVKTGYEDQFADGQVMSTGSPKGWIGGNVLPLIRCK